MRYLLAKWMSRRFRPFMMVEDLEFLEIFQMLNARIQIPSARTLARDVREIFAMSKSNVKELLEVRDMFLAAGLPSVDSKH